MIEILLQPLPDLKVLVLPLSTVHGELRRANDVA